MTLVCFVFFFRACVFIFPPAAFLGPQASLGYLGVIDETVVGGKKKKNRAIISVPIACQSNFPVRFGISLVEDNN